LWGSDGFTCHSNGLELCADLEQRFHIGAYHRTSGAALGLCQNAIYLGFNFYAMQTISASLASIIASSMPLIVAALSVVLFDQKLSKMGYVGLILGFAGVTLIMANRLGGAADPISVAMCVVAAIALSIATLTVKSASMGQNLLMVVGMQMWVGAATLVFPSMLFETWVVDWSMPVVIALSYSIIAPGIVATYIWFKLVERIGATKAASFHFLNPFFGVAVAAVILSETLSITDCIGVIIIMVGIYNVQRSKST